MLNKNARMIFSQLTNTPKSVLSDVNGISVDTRNLNRNDLFIALPGERVDGHDFLEVAKEKGAKAAIVCKGYRGQVSLPLIFVDSPFKTLQEWARLTAASSKSKVIAITGSVGKTTTKHFIAHLLSEKFRTAVSPGNSNSAIGLPLTILNHTQGDEEFLVLEMGMTHAGQIRQLVEIAPPDVAVLTTVALVHACNFESLAAIALAKAEIFSHPKTKLGIVHNTVENLSGIQSVAKCPLLTFGLSNYQAHFTGISRGSNFDVLGAGAIAAALKLPLLSGKHNLHNYLAAVSTVRYLGVSWEEISTRTKSLTLPGQRFQIIEKRGVQVIDDAYNAAPISMRAAMDSMPRPLEGGKTIAVFGAMLDLGVHAEQCHYDIGVYAQNRFDRLLCYGKECLPMQRSWIEAGKPVWHFSELSELIEELKKMITPGDVVLVKGSRSTGISKVVEEL